ncbi:MAG: hypothetical protein ACP5D9_02330 [Mariniphaga sp.]
MNTLYDINDTQTRLKVQRMMQDILKLNDEIYSDKDSSNLSIELLSQQLSDSMMKHVEKAL